jgi:hypothetical protein
MRWQRQKAAAGEGARLVAPHRGPLFACPGNIAETGERHAEHPELRPAEPLGCGVLAARRSERGPTGRRRPRGRCTWHEGDHAKESAGAHNTRSLDPLIKSLPTAQRRQSPSLPAARAGPFPSISASLSPFSCRPSTASTMSGARQVSGRRQTKATVIGDRPALEPSSTISAFCSGRFCVASWLSFLVRQPPPVPYLEPLPNGEQERRVGAISTAAKAGTGAAGVGRPNSAGNRLRQVTRSSSP